MNTEWGAALDPTSVLPEHPRPQLVREAWANLNGIWQYAFASAEQHSHPLDWDGDIVVPFPPEAPLSGVNRVLQPTEALWYRRTVTLSPALIDDRLLLHFGAVDQDCQVWVDPGTGPVEVGGHRGGVLPFTLDLTAALAGAMTFDVIVRVRDVTDTSHRSRGKQKLAPGGIWYTPHSGIWQSVWVEAVPAAHVHALRLDPYLDPGLDPHGDPHSDGGSRGIEVTVSASSDVYSTAQVTISADGAPIASVDVEVNTPTRIDLGPDARLWHPDDPFLHDVHIALGRDRVTSYVGLRTVALGPDVAGRTRMLLNGEPFLHAGLLDQGYWPDGLVTAPSDDALSFDVHAAKELGFTVLRKHVKVEPLRWYHHCDRLGVLVWQDMVNGGGAYNAAVVTAPVAAPVAAAKLALDDSKYARFGRQDAGGREEFLNEVDETVALLRNSPSVVVWVPFNEAWGQFDANAVAERVTSLDPTRLVDHASGWHDQGGGDLVSRHVYFQPYRLTDEDAADPRAAVLSEYGGYSHRIEGHTWSDREFGYRKIKHRDTYERAFLRLQHDQIGRAVDKGLAGFIHTQLSDVEQETNGLLTYDRRILKVDAEAVRLSNQRLKDRFAVSCGAEPQALGVPEREITTPVSLTLPDGRLNPEAVGWTRTPLIDTDGIGKGMLGKGRNKRWEYWAFTSPTHVVALVVSHIDYAGVNSLWVLDRATGQTVRKEATTPFGQGVSLPGTLGRGAATLRAKNFTVDITEALDGTHVRAVTERVSVDLFAARPRGHQALGVVVPWSDRQFQYTVKDVCRPAAGTITVDGVTHTLEAGESWATLDHGRGRWPHDIVWNWGAGSGVVDGRVIGIQVGGRWTDGTGSVENSIYVDGEIYKISQELVWSYDTEDWMKPWKVTGEGVDLTLTPFHLKESHTDLKLLSNHTAQVFGYWCGSVTHTSGMLVSVCDVLGWAEDVHNRW